MREEREYVPKVWWWWWLWGRERKFGRKVVVMVVEGERKWERRVMDGGGGK